MKLGVPMVDMTTGLNLVIGILMALVERQHSGRGQFVEVALYDAGISILHPHSGNWLMGGRLPRLLGNAHPNLAPYDLFPTATRPIYLGIGNEPQFHKAMAALGLDDVAQDPRFGSVPNRNANREALTSILRARLAGMDGVTISLALLKAGIPAGPLNTIEETLTDPQTQVREMVIEKDGYRGIGTPVKMGRTPGSMRHTPPDFGADNEEVLRAAGYSEAEISRLAGLGAVVMKRVV